MVLLRVMELENERMCDMSNFSSIRLLGSTIIFYRKAFSILFHKNLSWLKKRSVSLYCP